MTMLRGPATLREAARLVESTQNGTYEESVESADHLYRTLLAAQAYTTLYFKRLLPQLDQRAAPVLTKIFDGIDSP